MTEEQLSALLRVKRFEQPPPQYFDRLLNDLHRRQRAELLRRPLWKIATERLQTFFSEHSMGHLSYAGALASVLAIGVTAIGVMTSGGPAPVAVAKVEAHKPVVTDSVAGENSRLVTLRTPGRQAIFGDTSLPTADRVGYRPVGSVPRYVIDARPASYEQPSTVNF